MNTSARGRPVYVVDGARSPFLKARGTPGPFRAVDLAVAAARPLLLRQAFDATDLDEVIAGCVAPGPDEANIARIAALRLGCGNRVGAWTVQRNCGSGMQAIDSARRAIADGRADLILAGGTEAMSHAPLLWGRDLVSWLSAWSGTATWAERLRHAGRLRPRWFKPVSGLLRGLRDPVTTLSMGQTAEILAARFAITREAMDGFALRSHRQAAAAQDAEAFGEIEAVYREDGRMYPGDDGVRRDTSLERLAELRPVFDRPWGTVTAGNSAQVTDGAAWLVLASSGAVKRHDLPVIGRLVDGGWAALDPALMGLGPVYAATPLMKRHRWGMSGVDYWEINEAFAAQVLACQAAWQDTAWCRAELGLARAFGELPTERLNIDGGAIAQGHPVGATGVRIVLHLLHVLRRHNARRGVAALCIGGGQGGAMLVEAV